jgi:hypothetical protein
MKKVVKANWLSVIKAKQVKEQKLHQAQLCMAGYCTTKG